MLYSFDIEYFELPHQTNLRVTVIMDLPQALLSDVKLNPFVIDIVNHAFMKAGIKRVYGDGVNIVDCIFEHHTGIPDTAIDIICRYQKDPRRSNENSFSFKIAADIPVGYNFPYTNMVFTCSEDFEAYETLYQRGWLIKAPNIPNSITPIANGQYYLLYNLQNVEIMRVVDASCPNNVRMEAVAEDRTITSLTLSLANQGQIRPVRLSDKLLSMVGFAFRTGNLCGLVGIDYFEGVLSTQGNPQMHVHLQKDIVGYSLIIPDVNVQFGCRLIKCFYLHELQDILLREMNARISMSVQQLAAISFFFSKVELCCLIIETLPSVIETYRKSQQLSVTREQIVKLVATHYRISEVQASHFMIFQYLQ